MNTESFWILIITIIAAALLISDKIRPDIVALGVLVVMGLANLVPQKEVLAGFSGSAVITIISISLISTALYQTGVSRWLSELMVKLGKTSEWRLILIVMVTSAGVSLFMNNIAAVGVLLPAVMSLSRKSQTSPTRLMIPLAFGTTLGGMATLLTTANIIFSGSLRDAGLQPFGLLDFMPMGGPILIVGIVYMLLIGRRLLPHQNSLGEEQHYRQNHVKLTDLYQIDKNLYEIEILPESILAEKSIADGNWSLHTGFNIIGIIHHNRTYLAPSSDEIIHTGDHLIVQGSLDKKKMQINGLKSVNIHERDFQVVDETTTLAEAVVSPHASFLGRSLRQLNFRERYNLNVLALWRESRPIQKDVADIQLRFGDAILVQGSAADLRIFSKEPNWVLLEEDPDAVLKPQKQTLTLIITIITLSVAAFSQLPVALVVMAGAVMLLLTRCMDMDDAYRSIEWKAIFLIAGMWPLSTAIRTSGLADQAVNGITNLLNLTTPIGVAAVLVFLAFLFTQIMSGQVAALVLAPLALVAAQQLNVDAHGMSMGVALGCSLAFATPFAHPVNLMVMSSGGYKSKDYLRSGLPLTIIAYIMILLGLHLVWGF